MLIIIEKVLISIFDALVTSFWVKTYTENTRSQYAALSWRI